MSRHIDRPELTERVRPLRVLHVITDTDRRGAQVFAMSLAEELERKGHNTRTVALSAGSRGQRLEVEVLGGRARGWRALRRLRSEMQDADITIAHGSATLLACSLAGVGRTRPFIYRQISNSRYWARTPLRRIRVAMLLRRAAAVVALSKEAASTLHDHLFLPFSRITVIPNAVSGDDFAPASATESFAARTALGLPEGAFVALYVGALVTEKNVDVCIDAVADLPAVTLAIAGDGSLRTTLQEHAERVAPGRVHFLGDLQNVTPAYHAADALIMVSRTESAPAVVIEAGLCGVPVLCFPTGSTAEMVIDHSTGLHISMPRAVELKEALKELLDEPTRRLDLGAAAELYCRQRFTIQATTPLWELILSKSAHARSTASCGGNRDEGQPGRNGG